MMTRVEINTQPVSSRLEVRLSMKPLAERGRFELPEPVKVQRFSRPPHSTTLPPLRDETLL